MRTIKSFVLRAGRMSNRQQLALSQVLSQYEIPFQSDSKIILESVFGRKAATIVEIGFGMGRSLAEMAAQNPHVNFIGIEVYRPGIGSLIANLQENEISNVRVICHDAVEVLKNCFKENSLAGVQIFFPDPWHKKRHHKRRLIQSEFVKLLASRIQNKGSLHCATDWEDYAIHMQTVIPQEKTFVLHKSDDPLISGLKIRPITKYEMRGTKLGHRVWDLIYQKIE